MALETKLVWNGVIISKEMDLAIERALIRGTNKVQADAKRILTEEKHVDTGVLRGSIVNTVDANDKIGTVSTNIEYAPYIEFGTRFHPAYPFLSKSRDNNKEIVKKMFISELKKVTE